MDAWYKNRTAVVATALLLGVIGYFLFRNGHHNSSSPKEAISDVRSGEIEVKGIIACLPYRVATRGQECVKSIKGDDGKNYALNSIDVKGVENTMKEGTKVVGVGTFEEANTSVDDSSVFRYDGVLVLSSLTTR
jgi:hypothetical protein